MMSCTTIRRLAAAVFLVTFFAQCASAEIQTIALSGLSPYSETSEGTFASFSRPSLNNSGQVAFSATLAGESVTTNNDRGIWIASHSSFDQVMREDQAATGPHDNSIFSDTTFFPSTTIPFSDTGEVVFRSYVSEADESNAIGTVWAGRSGALRLIAYRGMQAPGAAEGKTFYVDNAFMAISRSGKVALAANFLTFRTLISDGYWVETEDGLQVVAAMGQQATGMGDNVAFSSVPLATNGPLVNSKGEVAFRALLSGPGISGQNDESVWIGSPGNLANLAREPVPLEQIGPGVTVRIFPPTGFNSNRSVALEGMLSGPGIQGGNSTANLLADPNGLTIVARAGEPAPDAPDDHIYTGFSYEPVIGSGGHVAFYGGDFDPSNQATRRTGIWAGLPGHVEQVVREGDPAPGTDLHFDWLIRNTPAINRFGQVAFPVDLEVLGTNTRFKSIWATDIDGNLKMVARAGESFDVAPGDERIIRDLQMITFHGDDDGRARSLNDLGQIAFWAGFTDNSSGLFVSNLVTHLPGDFDRNGAVDMGDYIVWRRAQGQTGDGLAADGTRDHRVDAADYAVWKEFFGRTAISTTATEARVHGAVPEPLGFVSLGIAIITIAFLRERIR